MAGENEGQAGSSSTTLEEFEREVAAPAAPATSIKLEGDDVPEEFRGKSVAEVLAMTSAMGKSLRISEDARLALANSAKERTDNPPPPEAPIQREPEIPQITREQLKELYDTDPIQAIEVMQQTALARAEQHVNRRMEQLQVGVIDNAEKWAREEFKDEFEVLGKDIENFRKSLPNQAAFTTKKGWQDLVSYVRGQPGNFEKFMEHKQNGGGKLRTLSIAREEQEANSGFTGGAPRRSTIVADDTEMDATEQKIMNEFIDAGTFKDKAEYLKWRKMGRQ